MRFLSFAVIALVQFSLFQAFGCSVPEPRSDERIAGTCQTNWKRIENQFLSYCIPSGLEEVKALSADTAVWKFVDSETTLRVEYGSHVMLIKDEGEDYKRDRSGTEIVVDEKPGIRREFRVHNDEVNSDPDLNGKLFATELYLESVNGPLSKLQITVFGRSERERKLASQIFASVRFKLID